MWLSFANKFFFGILLKALEVFRLYYYCLANFALELCTAEGESRVREISLVRENHNLVECYNTLLDLLYSSYPTQPHSLISLLSIQNNSYFKNVAKTCLLASKLSFHLWQCTFRFVQLCKYSPNSRYYPPSCLLAVFAVFLAIISPSSSCSSYYWNEWSVCHFCFHNQNNSTLSPGLLGNGALTCSGLHFWCHLLIKHKIIANLVISNWLWWIMRVLLANE